MSRPWHGHYFDATTSTQDEARAGARNGAPSRSIYVADFQRSGRGRRGRTWFSASSSALLASILFRERTGEPRPWRFTSLVSISLCEAVMQLLPQLTPTIKWPNDVMLAGGKLAGVLAETSYDGREIQAIVGVGVNVNATQAELAELPCATSLRIEARQEVNRAQLLSALIERLDRWLVRPVDDVHRAWAARLWGRGQRLRLLDIGREEEVVVLDIEPDGALLVRLEDGTEHRTTTGELLA